MNLQQTMRKETKTVIAKTYLSCDGEPNKICDVKIRSQHKF